MSFDFADDAHISFGYPALKDEKSCAKVIGVCFFQSEVQRESVCGGDMEMVDGSYFQRKDHIGVVQGVESGETVLRRGRKCGNNSCE